MTDAVLICGDEVITPAASVLSALEGVKVVTNRLTPFVTPVAARIVDIFPTAQHFGKVKIGAAFGPIVRAWFVVIAALGPAGIVRN